MSGTILLALRIAMAFALYVFLGWALLTLWRDLKHQSAILISLQPPRLTLLHIGGEDKQIYQFHKAEISIGRDPTCDCSLHDGTVSVKHARFFYRNGHWWVEDLNSTNGTFINNELVISPVIVTPDDQVRFGQVIMSIQVGDRVEDIHKSMPGVVQ